MSENHIVVFCTVPDLGSGEAIARALVEEKLAACVNLVPNLVSIYRWQDKLERDAECLMVIKTVRARFEALREAIVSRHPAELPEVIAVPITAGSETYLNWLTENTK